MAQQQGNDNPRGTVPRNPPRGGAQDQAQATVPADEKGRQVGGAVNSGTDAARGTPDVAGQQHGDPSASNRPENKGRHQ